MGALTRDTIVSEALLLAGNAALTVRANTWLNNWLRKQYASAPWPFLRQRIDQVSLPVGTQSFLLGAGAGGVAQAIQRIYDPILVRLSDYSSIGKIRVKSFLDGSIWTDESLQNPALFIGLPTQMKVRPTLTWGQWQLVPTPFPDKSYLLTIDYLLQPDDLALGTAIPAYPNDETMIQAVYVRALQFDAEDEGLVDAERRVLANMTADDRTRYLVVPGTNDSWALDGRVFMK